MLLAWIVVYFMQIAGSLAAVMLVAMGIRRYLRARARFRTKPWCLRCRYPCHDLPEVRCPECGRPAKRIGFVQLCRWDGWLSLLFLLAIVAAIVAVREPGSDRLYKLLPDAALADVQARGGRLATGLLPEFNRRLAKQGRTRLALLTASSWVILATRDGPLARAQPLGDGQTRIGFRKLGPPPPGVESSLALADPTVAIRDGAGAVLLHTPASTLGPAATGGYARGSMACDVAGHIDVASMRIELTAGPESVAKQLGRPQLLPPPITPSSYIKPDARMATAWMGAGTYLVVVSASPPQGVTSHAFDIICGKDELKRQRFLGWEWLERPGIIADADPHRDYERLVKVMVRW